MAEHAWKNKTKFCFLGWDPSWGFPQVHDCGWKLAPGAVVEDNWAHVKMSGGTKEVTAYGPEADVIAELAELFKDKTPLDNRRIIKKRTKPGDAAEFFVERKDGKIMVCFMGADLVLEDATKDYKEALKVIQSGGSRLEAAAEITRLKDALATAVAKVADLEQANKKLQEENAALQEKVSKGASRRLSA